MLRTSYPSAPRAVTTPGRRPGPADHVSAGRCAPDTSGN